MRFFDLLTIRTVILAAGICMAANGCRSVEREVHECYSDQRDHHEACVAWKTVDECYTDIPHRKDFKRGFIAGYVDVLNGGVGCQPDLPPAHYWSPCYQDLEGHAQVNAWFDGFTHGAIAAQSDGSHHFRKIPISPEAREAMRSRQVVLEHPHLVAPGPVSPEHLLPLEEALPAPTPIDPSDLDDDDDTLPSPALVPAPYDR